MPIGYNAPWHICLRSVSQFVSQVSVGWIDIFRGGGEEESNDNIRIIVIIILIIIVSVVIVRGDGVHIGTTAIDIATIIATEQDLIRWLRIATE